MYSLLTFLIHDRRGSFHLTVTYTIKILLRCTNILIKVYKRMLYDYNTMCKYYVMIICIIFYFKRRDL